MDKIYKAAVVDVIRQELDKRGPAAEAAFYGRLSSEDQALFRSLLPMAWVTAEYGARILQAAASTLYEGEREPFWELGKRQAQHDLKLMYRVLLKVATVPTVIGRAAHLFGTYHGKGKASVEHAEGATHGAFVVVEYPEMPPQIRMTISGYILGLLELTGAKEARVRLDERQPKAWRWEIQWR